MQLYLNKKEVPAVKTALEMMACLYADPVSVEIVKRVLERMELCEQLQDNERKGGRGK